MSRSNSSSQSKGVDIGLDGIAAPEVCLQPDCAPGRVQNGFATTSASIGTVVQVTEIPTWARFVKLYHESAGVLGWAFNADPVLDAADTTSPFTWSTLGCNGGFVLANTPEVRSIPDGMTSLRLVGSVASIQVRIEFSGA